MISVVEHHAATAALRFVVPPFEGAQRHGPAVLQRTLDGLHAYGDRLPDRAGIEKLLRPDERRVEAEVLEHPELRIDRAGGRDHRVALGDVDRHGLLHGHVLSGADGIEGHGRVQVVGRDDVHRVHIRVFEEASVVGVGPRSAPLGCPLLGHAGSCVAHRGNLGPGVGPVAPCVQFGDAARADDPDTHRIQGVVSLQRGRSPPG